ncbi:unnamed protein product [Lampetra planeri]
MSSSATRLPARPPARCENETDGPLRPAVPDGHTELPQHGATPIPNKRTPRDSILSARNLYILTVGIPVGVEVSLRHPDISDTFSACPKFTPGTRIHRLSVCGRHCAVLPCRGTLGRWEMILQHSPSSSSSQASYVAVCFVNV